MTKALVDKAPKRDKAQIEFDRMRESELYLQGYTHAEIRDILERETGISLSRRTIGNDLKAIRKGWLDKREKDYEAFVNREADRIDVMERELWKAWRNSCEDASQEIIEQVAKALQEAGDDEAYELVTKKVTRIVNKNNGVGNPKFLSMIIDAQKERRKLFGLYAPARLGIDINKKSEILIKGYAIKEVSPDAWPDIIEGELVDIPLLESENE